MVVYLVQMVMQMAMGAVQVCVSIQTFYFKVICDTPLSDHLHPRCVHLFLFLCGLAGFIVDVFGVFPHSYSPSPFLQLVLMPNERFPLGVSLECNVDGGWGGYVPAAALTGHMI